MKLETPDEPCLRVKSVHRIVDVIVAPFAYINNEW